MEQQNNNNAENAQTPKKAVFKVGEQTYEVPYDVLASELPDDVEIDLGGEKYTLKDIKEAVKRGKEQDRDEAESKLEADYGKIKKPPKDTASDEITEQGKTSQALKEIYKAGDFKDEELLKEISELENLNIYDNLDEYNKRSAGVLKKMMQRLTDSELKRIQAIQELQNLIKEHREEEAVRQQVYLELQEAKRHHPWIDPNSKDYNPVLASMLKDKLNKVDAKGNRINVNKSIKELADEVKNEFDKIVEKHYAEQIKKIEELKQKSVTLGGGAVQGSGYGVEQLSYDEAKKRARVPSPFGEE